jgi:spermidine synthase
LAVEVLLLVGVLSLKLPALLGDDRALFAAGELLRFFSAFYLLIIPCLLLGLSFPLLLNLATRSADGVATSVGRIYAANTLGAVLGSALTGFVVLPALGSLSTLRAAATLNLLLGLGFAWFLVTLPRVHRLVLALVAASLAMLFWLEPAQWDARRMTRGSYVYFTAGWPIDRVLYFQEDVQGGLTSVVQMGATRVMLSNGKFQGNNTGEVGAQARFAMIPMLFTPNLDKALVIGLGTGNTLRVVSRFAFRQIDAVEIAPHIVDAARLWFRDVNSGVFDRDPRVRLSLADGRNFLLVSNHRYDLITIEVSSIWISGEADLYNREFYDLCRAHMTDRGVLQQWVQIHHMRTQDLLVILNTAARVFPHLAFFVGPEQGLLIASPGPLECDYRNLAAYDADPGVREELQSLQLPSMASLLGEMVLYGESFHRVLALLPPLSGLPPDFASTDNQPYLEYQTPKGNTVSYDTSVENTRLLEQFRAPLLPPDLVIRNLPSEDEQNLLLAYAAEGRGDMASAREYFGRVQGAARTRAEAEVSRLNSRPRAGQQ